MFQRYVERQVAESLDAQAEFPDSGVLAATRGLTLERIGADRTALGPLLENFVFAEVLKLMAASDLHLLPHHFRDRDTREVDIVLEHDDGAVAGIEVKAGATVRAGEFAGLRAGGRLRRAVRVRCRAARRYRCRAIWRPSGRRADRVPVGMTCGMSARVCTAWIGGVRR